MKSLRMSEMFLFLGKGGGHLSSSRSCARVLGARANLNLKRYEEVEAR